MAVCAICGTDLPRGARFCPNCGSAVAEAQRGGRERKLVTVLFADVTGSTTLGERLDPERMREVMDAFFAAMRAEIEAEGGTVEKYIGDAVMAAFGVPHAHEDDPARALRAALHMLQRLEVVNQELAKDHDVTLEIRIGVNTGEVLATTEPRPGESMVTGDAVNAASRLETVADPGQVIASERTVRAVRGFRVEDMGALDLKGKARRVHAFRVLDETTTLPERGVPGLQAPLVGRDDEIDLLESIYGRIASEGRPHLVTLYGDAGVGKSRLTREFLDRLGDQALVLHGRCLPYGEGVTFWPLAEILKAHAGVLDTDPSDIALERIQKAGLDLLTEDVTIDPGRTTAALAFTVGVEDPAYAFSRMDPKEVRVEVHAAWRSFFSALAMTQAVVVLVEDIHWADPALLDLLEDLAERSIGPLLFICPSRPELTARRPGWGGGRRNHTAVTLDPLTSQESERLVGFLLAIDDLPATVRGRILERGEGNPFFLEEIICHLIDERFLVHEDGRWRTAAGIEHVEIPDTVQGVLAARIDLLERDAKRVLQSAAVVGRVFWPGSLRGLGEAVDVDTTLAELEARELVLSRLGSSIAGEPEFIFKHILTRDVAYESLPKRERAPAHAAVAGWIEQTSGARAREFVELLAYHYATAIAESVGAVDDTLRRKAFEYLVAASRESRSKQVLKRAQRFAEEALRLASDDRERSAALEALGDAFLTDYVGDLAWKYYREAAHARAAAAEGSNDPKVAYLCARACEVPTRWPGSMRRMPGPADVEPLLALGMSHLPEGDSEERVRLQSIRASWPFAFPDPPMTEEEALNCELIGLEAAEMALRLGMYDLASGALDASGGFGISRGLYARVRTIQERRLDIMPHVSDQLEVGDAYAMIAWSDHELGQYREGLGSAEEGVRLVEGTSGNAGIHAASWQAVLEYRLGAWDRALATFERVRALLDDRRDDPPYFATHAFAAMGIIAERRDDSVQSDRMTGLLVPLGGGFSTRLLPWLVLLLVERGDLAPAKDLLDHLPPAWRVHTTGVLEARCELVAFAGAWPQVSALAEEARAYSAASEALPPSVYADRLEGRAALAADDPETAVPTLTRAVEGFDRLRTPYDAARTSVDLAKGLILLDRRAEAAVALDRAAATFEQLRATKAQKIAGNVRGELEG
jgi:class 3 adenylate cyclase/tetratricopeptide (TPR) repeat protein